MQAPALPHPEPRPPADMMSSRQRRLDGLRTALVETRKSWRWWRGKFWTLRWENTLRRPSWRVEEETKAWQRMREEVGRYAAIRAQIRDIERSGTPAALEPAEVA
jgi:hypothetical protein